MNVINDLSQKVEFILNKDSVSRYTPDTNQRRLQYLDESRPASSSPDESKHNGESEIHQNNEMNDQAMDQSYESAKDDNENIHSSITKSKNRLKTLAFNLSNESFVLLERHK